MKIVTLERPGRLVLGEVPLPGSPGPEEALVRVQRVGICGSDFHAFQGNQPLMSYPRTLGHELGVEIVEVAANRYDLRVGDRCAVEPYLECGRCIACRRGKTNCCAALQVLGVHVDGGMREMTAIPLRKLHRSRSLSFDQLALIETLSIGAHAVNRAQLDPGEWVLVVGAGPIGLSVVQFARVAGARVLVADLSEDRLAFCRRHLRPEATIASADEKAVRDALGGELPTAVFDATGNAASMARCFELVANGGKLIFVGLCQGQIAFADPEFHRREMTVFASRNSVGGDFRRIIELVEAGTVDTRPWITHRTTLDELCSVLPAWMRPEAGVVKGVVEM